jgi:DNA polymerase I-like protein with 3'-5' exonuclease and polymerase domains
MMVAKTVPLPNVRELFIPDAGYIICDCDLDRADLQVVVWEADEPDLKRQLRLGVDIHIMNGILLEGHEPPPEDELVETHPEYPEHKKRYKGPRQFAKSFVHGTDYGGSARTMAINCGITVKRSEWAQNRWFSIYPGIKRWHNRVEHSLMTTRTVTNAFGYRRVYFDRVQSILPEALAWIPQSTVAIVTNKGIINLDNNMPMVEMLLQNHDSNVFQFPRNHYPHILPEIRKNLLIEVPYEDPLTIPVGLKVSEKSWGDCKEVPWIQNKGAQIAV